MYTGLNHLHSANRYLIVAFLIITLVDAALSMSNSEYNKRNKTFALVALILVHIQTTLGLIQYFLSPWFQGLMENASDVMSNPQARFYAVEHWLIMIAATVLITIGYSKAKKIEEASRKYKTLLIFYGIGFALIFIGIPWPFMKSFGTWF